MHVAFQICEVADSFIICYVSISHNSWPKMASDRLLRSHLSELEINMFPYFILPEVNQCNSDIILQVLKNMEIMSTELLIFCSLIGIFSEA